MYKSIHRCKCMHKEYIHVCVSNPQSMYALHKLGETTHNIFREREREREREGSGLSGGK